MKKRKLIWVAIVLVWMGSLLLGGGMACAANKDGVTFAKDGKWLPDPSNIFGTDGEFFQVNTESNGLEYASYLYTVDATIDQMGKMISVYEEVMRDIGCTVKQYKLPDKAIRYEGYICDDVTPVEFVLYVKDGAKELSEGGTGTFLASLMIPVSEWYFEPGKGSNLVKGGQLRCVECGGTGLCKYCGGTGRANYGDGYEDCIICDGTGTCDVCGGIGSY